MQRRAFTLIELLVVIAIISLLAALLFPVFASAREKARQATCASNFKQQAIAIALYQQDNDELMPLMYANAGPLAANGLISLDSPPATVMAQTLQPYLKNTQVYCCPSDPVSEEQRAISDVPPPVAPQQRQFNLGAKTNFGFNFQYLSPLLPNAVGGYSSLPTPIAQIEAPAQTVLAVDSLWLRDANGAPYGGGSPVVDIPCWTEDAPHADQLHYWFGGWNPGQPASYNVYGRAWPWHGKFATTAFCDGHVKALTMSALSAGCDVKDRWGGIVTDRDKYLWDLH